MLKDTMLHTTGYQKLLYGKENITLMKLNNQYVPSLRLSMTECILVVILKNNSSKPAVYRACSLSTFIIYRRLLADCLLSVGHGKLRVTYR